MRTSYKTLTDAEFDVLNEIAYRTGMDCWFYIEQDSDGTDYVWDCEESKSICLKTGIEMLCEGLDCQENYDSCELTEEEDEVFRGLLNKLNIEFNF